MVKLFGYSNTITFMEDSFLAIQESPFTNETFGRTKLISKKYLTTYVHISKREIAFNHVRDRFFKVLSVNMPNLT